MCLAYPCTEGMIYDFRQGLLGLARVGRKDAKGNVGNAWEKGSEKCPCWAWGESIDCFYALRDATEAANASVNKSLSERLGYANKASYSSKRFLSLFSRSPIESYAIVTSYSGDGTIN